MFLDDGLESLLAMLCLIMPDHRAALKALLMSMNTYMIQCTGTDSKIVLGNDTGMKILFILANDSRMKICFSCVLPAVHPSCSRSSRMVFSASDHGIDPRY